MDLTLQTKQKIRKSIQLKIKTIPISELHEKPRKFHLSSLIRTSKLLKVYL